MTKPNDLAFPLSGGTGSPGLTKREWFAGMALQGLLTTDREGDRVIDAALTVVQFADAVIKCLNEGDCTK